VSVSLQPVTVARAESAEETMQQELEADPAG